jgi:high-affinity K+ transport system ATPase subunit B
LQDRMQQEGKTAVLVSADGKGIGAIGLLDMAKEGAKEVVAALKSLGIGPVMVTGGNIRDAVSAIETSKKNSRQVKAKPCLRVHVQRRPNTCRRNGPIVSRACRPCDGSKLYVSNSELACASAVEPEKIAGI